MLAALASLSLSSRTGTDGNIPCIPAKITNATPTPDTAQTQAEVAVIGAGAASGAQKDDRGTQAGGLGRRSVPQGLGFAMSVVSQNIATVECDRPVLAADTMLTQWVGTGTSAGANHTIKQVRSDHVAVTSIHSTRITLDWGQACRDDGRYDPWNATREIILIAAYGSNHGGD